MEVCRYLDTIFLQYALIIDDGIVSLLTFPLFKFEICLKVGFVGLLAEEVRKLGTAARLAIFLKIFIGKQCRMLFHLFRGHLLVRFAIQSLAPTCKHFVPLCMPSRSQILIRRDILHHQADRVDRKAHESKSDHTRVHAHSDAQKAEHAFVTPFEVEFVDLIGDLGEVANANTSCDEGMQRGHGKEGEEVLEVALADAGAHPRAVMVLRFNADSAGAAMESSWRSDYHASSAQRQSVRLSVRIDDTSKLKTILVEKVF